MKLPEIQTRIHEIADELLMPLLFPRDDEERAKELHHLAEAAYRRKSVRKAPVASRKMTPELAEAIRRDFAANPTFTQQRIAERHGVTAGRVSEAVRGKRE